MAEDYGNYGLYNMDEREPLILGNTPYLKRKKARLNSKYPAEDINTFFSLVALALKDYYATYKVEENDQFRPVPCWPEELAEDQLGSSFNFITYRLIGRSPQTASDSGKPRLGPYRFDDGPDPEYAGYRLTRSILVRENDVKFEVISTSYPLAEDFALWFETQFIDLYSGNFEAYGMKGPYFIRREADLVEKMYNRTVYRMPLVYRLVTQSVQVSAAKTLDSIKHAYEL